MDHRPQHAGETMETQSGFDLETAIADWREELAKSPDLTDDDLRELESHLRETIDTQSTVHPTDEAAFNAAVNQLGTPDRVCGEHAKVNSESRWKERLFWACWASLLFPAIIAGEQFLTLGVSNLVSSHLRAGISSYYVTTAAFHTLSLLMLFTIVRRIQTGRLPWLRRSVASMNGYLSLMLDSDLTRVLTGIALPCLSLLALWVFSRRATVEGDLRQQRQLQGTIVKISLVVLLVVLTKLGAQWIDSLRYAFDTRAEFVIGNVLLSIMWPLGTLWAFLRLRSSSIRARA